MVLAGVSVPATIWFWYLNEKYHFDLVKMYIWTTLAEGFLLPLGALWVYEEWQMFVVAIAVGITQAPKRAFGRAILVGMLPKGREAQFFSFNMIVDKGTAWLGPAWLVYFRNNVTTYRN